MAWPGVMQHACYARDSCMLWPPYRGHGCRATCVVRWSEPRHVAACASTPPCLLHASCTFMQGGNHAGNLQSAGMHLHNLNCWGSRIGVAPTCLPQKESNLSCMRILRMQSRCGPAQQLSSNAGMLAAGPGMHTRGNQCTEDTPAYCSQQPYNDEHAGEYWYACLTTAHGSTWRQLQEGTHPGVHI